jgi:hypothetical protein
MRYGAAWVGAAALLMAGCSSGEKKRVTEVEYNCPANALEIQVLQRETAVFEAETGQTLRDDGGREGSRHILHEQHNA